MATDMGNAIAAATGGFGGLLYAALIMGIWAAGEAAIDIDTLKKGDEVPLVKTKENWNLSIYGIDNLDKNEETDKDFFSLNYSEYLGLLLMSVNQETKLLRIQDIIELNLTEFYGNRFYLGNFYNGININCNFEIDTFTEKITIKEGVKLEY